MFCPNCGKNIEEDSKFCQFCGVKVSLPEVSKKAKNEPVSQQTNSIWDKFVDIYNSKGEERRKYEENSSNEVWELINRISINTFESFIEEYRDALNKQPYKVIEVLKSTFQLSATGGYWFWMAEAMLKTNPLGGLKPIDFENFIGEWRKVAIDNYTETSKKLSEELMVSMSNFHNFRMETLFESSPTIKELSNEFIEKLKSSLIMQIIWGYIIGLIESKYRK